METTFYILLNIKTNGGFESYGRFNIGNDREVAYALFKELKGKDAIEEKDVLCIELMETVYNLPVNIMMKSCTLNELTGNCRLITKELFNRMNLNGGNSIYSC